MQRPDSLEKTLMLGMIEGRRRSGRERMRWLDGITDLMDMSLSKLQELVMNWHAVVLGVTKRWTWLNDLTELSAPLAILGQFYENGRGVKEPSCINVENVYRLFSWVLHCEALFEAHASYHWWNYMRPWNRKGSSLQGRFSFWTLLPVGFNFKIALTILLTAYKCNIRNAD